MAVRETAERRSLLADERGNAYAEAVIMLPFFLLIFALIMFVDRGYEQAVRHTANARRHAWGVVMADCEADPPVGVDVEDASDPILGPLGDAVRFLDRLIGFVPFLRSYWPGFTDDERLVASSTTVERPKALGGGDARSGYHLVLMCNQQLRPDFRIDAMIDRAWELLGGGL